jgi:AcrR family transcriptional regulator
MGASTRDHVETSRDARQRAIATCAGRSVLVAARRRFFDLGLDGTSMREIAKRAGYTAGALYSYFSSKEEIYAALLGESLENLNARVEGAAAQGEGVVATFAAERPGRRRRYAPRRAPSSTLPGKTRAISISVSTCFPAWSRAG